MTIEDNRTPEEQALAFVELAMALTARDVRIVRQAAAGPEVESDAPIEAIEAPQPVQTPHSTPPDVLAGVRAHLRRLRDGISDTMKGNDQ